MSKTAKIILVSAVVLTGAGILLIIYSQDAKRKKYAATTVPPDYAKDIINQVSQKYHQ